VSGHLALSLRVQHRYCLDGGHDDGTHSVIARIPPETDVYAAQAIIISLSGALNNTKISAQKMASSHLVRHLIDYLQTATLYDISMFS
jgi:hypothetical protein